MFASATAQVAIAALTQDRALIGLLRSVVDPSNELLLVTSEAELTPHLNSRRVSVAILDSMFVEGDLAGLAERLRDTWNDLVLVVVGTAEEQSKVASQITSGVVYRFLHRPVSAPRVRLFVEAALRRHEVENVERTLEQARPDFSKLEASKGDAPRGKGGAALRMALVAVALAMVIGGGGWYVFSSGRSATSTPAVAEVASPPPAEAPAVPPPESQAPAARPAAAAPVPHATTPPPAHAVVDTPPAPPASVAENLRQASSPIAPGPSASEPARMLRTQETPVELPAATPAAPVQSREERRDDLLKQAETALQRGQLYKPPGTNAVDLFRAVLEIEPGNALAKGGLVRVADRLHAAAERSLTAGNVDDAKQMVEVAESLTPATARGAFLMMQIEMEHDRAVLTAKRDSDVQDKQEKGATYLRLANTRLRGGQLIEPPEDNARFYLEAARQLTPEDPGVQETARALQKELLTRAGAAASAGNAAETERWLANADGAGAARPDQANVRKLLQDTLIGAKADRSAQLLQSFNAALAANQLLQPADSSAKAYLLQLMDADAGSAAVTTARQGLGVAYLRELRAALGRGDLAAADAWRQEAHTITFSSAELNAAETELANAHASAAQRDSVVGANSLARTEYVAPKFPAATRNRNMSGWVELEFTVRSDGSTGDIVVTNSSPRRTFDAAAVTAVEQWRYKPVMHDGRAVDQRASIRIRFSDE
ncbi:MAG TPA: energy transducer TonB [Steroidobacteraceae bacterium]|nr:energy transducer TonB [Steroidobacteraceae bacterium]